MLEVLAFVLAGIVLVVAVELIADRTGLPTAVLLTVAGLIYAVLPGPDLTVPPAVVFTFVLPPLIYSAALNASLIEVRRNLAAIGNLSVVLVLLTALGVGTAVHLLVPGVKLAAALALGAAVAPPDPVASLAVGRRAGVPHRLITLIEGEGLLNDATALTIFTVALAGVTEGGFSPGFAVLQFLWAAAGGAAVGVLVAWFMRLVRPLLHEPIVANTVSLATPFLAYLVAEGVHASAFLAVAVTGLVVGHDTPRSTSGHSRLQIRAVWRLVDFGLESFVFLLIGQQLPVVVRHLNQYAITTVITAVAATLGVTLLLRPLYLFITHWLPQCLRRRSGSSGDLRYHARLSGREVLALSWAGTRGVVTLSSVLTLPYLVAHGQPFHDRSLLIFCAYLVVVTTLVGQGISFAPLTRLLRLPAEPDRTRLHARARAAAARAALARLDTLARQEDLGPAAVDTLRQALEARADVAPLGQAGRDETDASVAAVRRVQYRMIDIQRAELIRWRHIGRLRDDSLRALLTELDHEEHATAHEPA